MMKKILCFFLVLCMMLPMMAACNNGSSDFDNIPPAGGSVDTGSGSGNGNGNGSGNGNGNGSGSGNGNGGSALGGGTLEGDGDTPGGGEPNVNGPREVYGHVVIVGVDGGGTWFDTADMPNLDSIFEGGMRTEKCLTSNPTISAQCWASLLTGVVPTLHGMNNDLAKTTVYDKAAYPTMFSLLKKANPNAVMGSFASWKGIYGLVENGIGVTKVTGDQSTATSTSKIDVDKDTVNQAAEFILQNQPNLMFIQLDDADVKGEHVGTGFGQPEYLATLAEIDKLIGKIYQAIVTAGMADDTLFIVTADHGGVGTSHGRLDDSEKYVMFAAKGKSIMEGDDMKMHLRDIPAIVAWALGIEGNTANWDSFVPENLFNDNKTPTQREDVLRECKVAPVAGEAGYIGNFIDLTTLKAGLLFDDLTLTDLTGKTVTGSKVYRHFEDGYSGKGIRVDTQNGFYLSYNDLTFGTDSFAISMWFKPDNIDANRGSDVAIYGNKNWKNGKNAGLTLAWDENRILWYNMGDGTNRIDVKEMYPDPKFDTMWHHSLIVVDRTAKKIRAYVDFQLIYEVELGSEFNGVSFDTGNPFNIGCDGVGTYGFDGVVDDFLVFDHAISATEIASLKAYYSQG